MLTKKNAKAYAVLSYFYDLCDEYYLNQVYIEPYLNGREDGFSIFNLKLKVCFSENRNSDSIVVYFGKTVDFCPQGNCPNEETYKEREYFRFDEAYKVAKHIIKLLFNKDV